MLGQNAKVYGKEITMGYFTNLNKQLQVIVLIITIIAGLAGLWWGLESKFAAAADLKIVAADSLRTTEMVQEKLEIDINALRITVARDSLAQEHNMLIEQKFRLR